MTDVRGNPWEHDPGPSGSSGWAEVFAGTPNYRGLGHAVLGREAFRWQHGPMFFRGRLDGSAKVLVVGQEGAQDESLSHRSFTGGTGARMQYLLRFLGFDRAYLDLPYGTLRWAGTSGDRAVRPVDTGTGKPSPDYLKLFLPAWAAKLDPAPLTADEQLAAKQLT
jgi:hypothetical protein